MCYKLPFDRIQHGICCTLLASNIRDRAVRRDLVYTQMSAQYCGAYSFGYRYHHYTFHKRVPLTNDTRAITETALRRGAFLLCHNLYGYVHSYPSFLPRPG